MKTRIVITGFGGVTPCGIIAEKAMENIFAGISGIGPITRFDTTQHACKIGGEVKNFEASDYGITKKERGQMDLAVQYGVAAAYEAICHSKLQLSEDSNPDVGIVMGVGIGNFSTITTSAEDLSRGADKIKPRAIPNIMNNAVVANISIKHKITGFTDVSSTACASSASAIAESIMVLETGRAKVMLAGGTDAISELPSAGFGNSGAVNTKNNDNPEHASRPFSKDREGFGMGEGSVVIVLEELEHALARGAVIYAEVAGFGVASDAFHVTEPGGGGAQLAIRRALQDAGIKPESIDYINAHGTATPKGDIVETNAIKEVFGGYAYDVDISSTKSVTGHLIGAAGALEFWICCMAVLHDEIPPTMNLTEDNKDPECDLHYTPGKSKKMQVNYAQSDSFGFGGHCVVHIVKKYTDK